MCQCTSPLLLLPLPSTHSHRYLRSTQSPHPPTYKQTNTHTHTHTHTQTPRRRHLHRAPGDPGAVERGRASGRDMGGLPLQGTGLLRTPTRDRGATCVCVYHVCVCTHTTLFVCAMLTLQSGLTCTHTHIHTSTNRKTLMPISLLPQPHHRSCNNAPSFVQATSAFFITR